MKDEKDFTRLDSDASERVKKAFDNYAELTKKLNEVSKKEKPVSLIDSLLKGLGWTLGSLIVFVIFGGFIIYFSWAHAFVITKLWAWFIVPIFGVEPIKLLPAMGLTILIGLFTQGHTILNIKSEENEDNRGLKVFLLIVCPWVSLLFGYIVHILM